MSISVSISGAEDEIKVKKIVVELVTESILGRLKRGDIGPHNMDIYYAALNMVQWQLQYSKDKLGAYQNEQ